jgi:hypothetical protein
VNARVTAANPGATGGIDHLAGTATEIEQQVNRPILS